MSTRKMVSGIIQVAGKYVKYVQNEHYGFAEIRIEVDSRAFTEKFTDGDIEKVVTETVLSVLNRK